MEKAIVERWLERSREQKRIEDLLEKELSEKSRLTLNEYYVLYFLNQAPKKRMRLNDLQQVIGLSQSAMSRMVTRMEDKNCGVIERHICVDDKRGIYIGLTELGLEKLSSGQKVVEQVLTENEK